MKLSELGEMTTDGNTASSSAIASAVYGSGRWLGRNTYRSVFNPRQVDKARIADACAYESQLRELA